MSPTFICQFAGPCLLFKCGKYCFFTFLKKFFNSRNLSDEGIRQVTIKLKEFSNNITNLLNLNLPHQKLLSNYL